LNDLDCFLSSTTFIYNMPKIKKIRAAALSKQGARQEPLGQVIESDALKGKFAAPVRGSKQKKESQGDDEGEFLDPKTSARILDLSRDQRLEIQTEEQLEWRRKQQTANQEQADIDSDDDDEEEEEIEDVYVDEGDE
jgi:hypothetical protein